MPQVVNPKAGYIVACNQQLVSLGYKHLVGTAVPTTGRAYRANELLKAEIESGRKMDLEFMKSMQLDNHDAVARELCKLLIPLTEKHLGDYFNPKSAKRASISHMLGILKAWNHVADEDSKGALVFYMWLTEIMNGYLQEQVANPVVRRVIVQSYTKEHFLGRWAQRWSEGEGLNSTYCANSENKGMPNPCIYNVVNGLLKVRQEIVGRFGSSERNWKWGYDNIVRSLSDTFSSTPFRLFFERLYLSYVLSPFIIGITEHFE